MRASSRVVPNGAEAPSGAEALLSTTSRLSERAAKPRMPPVNAADCAFIVNTRSGGGQGRALLVALRKRVGTDRVADLADVRLVDWVRQWGAQSAGLIACGGDGTIAAVLETAHALGLDIPVGVMPLGTGNDLARVANMPLGGRIEVRLAALTAAQPRAIDRWVLHGPGLVRGWYNYCSWGVDARIAERFHRLRAQHPRLFFARAANLLAYAAAGLQEPGLILDLTLATAAPPWLRSLAVLNIPSYAGGRLLGSAIRPNDGLCDAFALGTGVALGLALSGKRRPRRLGQHRRLAVTLRRAGYLQLDGEPLLAPPGAYVISHGGQVRLLAGAVALPT